MSTQTKNEEEAKAPAPKLIASIEVYKAEDGTYHTNLTHDGNTEPQHTSDDDDDVVGAVEEFLRERFEKANEE